MAPVSDYSTTASSNTTISGINIAENCPAGNLNNAQRQLMADIRTVLSDLVLGLLDDASYAAMRATLGAAENTAALSSVGGLTPAGDRIAYYTGASAAALATLTAFARSLLDDADAATARVTLGAVGIVAVSLANPGYISFNIPSVGTFTIQWGSASIPGNTASQTVTYPTPFSSFSIPVVSGGLAIAGADENYAAVTAAAAANFTVSNSYTSGHTFWWIAVGV